MPRRYWIPLRLREWPLQQHVHAAVTAWFDDGAPYGTSRKPHGPAVASHDEKQKAYTISCPTMRDGIPGIEVSTLSDGADSVMEWVASELPVLRLGRQREVLVGRPQVLMDRPWSRIAQEPALLGSGWHVEFLTPTMFRTGEAVDLLPTPARCWGRPSPNADATSRIPCRTSLLGSSVICVSRTSNSKPRIWPSAG